MQELTVREREIAELAAAGRRNDEIARALGIGSRTVEWNLTRIYRKLGVRSKVELAACFAGTPWADEPIAENGNRKKTERLPRPARAGGEDT
jgi:DNA-binding CsgD family transcriptional regulator